MKRQPNREPDLGSETRLMRRARDVGMTRTEATQKRLAALDEYANSVGMRSVDREILTQHIMLAAATVWPDQTTDDFLRRLT